MILIDDKLGRGSNPPCHVAGRSKGKESRLRRFAHSMRQEPIFVISTGRNPLKSLDSEK
jgi:hypothetical protein